MIGVPLGVVLLPSMSREAARGGDGRRSGALLVRALRLLVFVMLPITALGDRRLRTRSSTLLFDYGAIDDRGVELDGRHARRRSCSASPPTR